MSLKVPKPEISPQITRVKLGGEKET